MSTVALPSEDLERWRDHSVLTISGDITSEDVRQECIGRTLAQFGRIDVLVNNAGVGLYAPPSTLSIDLFRHLFEINVAAPLALTQLAIPIMRRQGSGVIVNLGSVGGTVSLPWAAAYCSSKFAMHGITDSLRRELRTQGIRVIKICPGIVDTGFRQHVLGGSAPVNVKELRVISAESVASAIFRAVESSSSRTVFVPRIGRLFCAMQTCFPSLMDWYIARLYDSGEDARNFCSGITNPQEVD